MQTYKSAATSTKQLPRGVRHLAEHGLLKAGTVNLDLGGGRFTVATEYLDGYGVENLVLDPYCRPETAQMVLQRVFFNPADSGTCLNVLNVIRESGARLAVLRSLKQMVKQGGVICIQVYEGDGTGYGKQSRKKDSWQEHRKTATYLPEVQTVWPGVPILTTKKLMLLYNEGR